MTPTLLGRWQTRGILFATVGIGITLLVAVGLAASGIQAPVWLIWLYALILGWGWDILYHFLQSFRWDRDWPAAFQILACIGEGLFLVGWIKGMGLPGIDRTLPLGLFLLHYSLVWLGMFTASQTLMRVVFPRWRFRGGQWWGKF